MKHDFLDAYRDLDSPLHRVDARVRWILGLALILSIVTVPASQPFALATCGVLICLGVVASKLPFRFVLSRLLVLLPFVLVMASVLLFAKAKGGPVFCAIVVKALFALLAMLVLTATTPFTELIRILRWMKLPDLFTAILSFMYRYLFVLEDERERLVRAKESRTAIRRWPQERKALSQIVGVLFIRSYERSERVYQAMCARGFNGTVPCAGAWERWGPRDWVLLGAGLAVFVLIRLGGMRNGF